MSGFGAAFSIDAATGTERLLYSFTPPADGYDPKGTPVYLNGFLYGTAAYGGANNYGTIYQINVATGAETVIYNFTGTKDRDGEQPESSLIYHAGVLYGTTTYGGSTATGASYDGGTVFSFNLATDKEKVLHRFGVAGDGSQPYGDLVLNQGILYGTTQYGGSAGQGAIFKLDPSPAARYS